MEYQNLRFLQESLLKTQGIFSWSLTKAGQLLYSNAPDQEYYEKLLHQSTTKEIILSHFSERHVPLIAVDELGLAWIAACQDEKEEETFSLLHLLGPVRSIEMTESYLKQNPSPVLRDDYLSYLRRLPTLLSDVAVRYACLLAASISETTITPDMVEILTPPMPKTEAPGWADASYHGTWEEEQRLFHCIMEGNLEGMPKTSSGRIGQIGGGNPLRQAKNEMIIFSVLCSRGAILGGVSSEGAYNLSDYYLDQLERAKTIPQVSAIGEEMVYSFIQRVQEAKKEQGEAELLRVAKEYISTHIFEKISLKEMAKEIGYSETHLSRRFKSLSGISLTEMIARKKIEMAKRIMDDASSSVSIADLSHRLCYSSTSHFCSVFRKTEGMSPSEYQNREGRGGEKSKQEESSG